MDAYIGGFYIWLLAGIFWLTGVSALTPRLVMAVAGALAVGITYLLARDLGGRLAGLIAAALLATSGAQILSNGHIAWSHCLTPTLTTLAAWLLQRAIRQDCRGSWLASGFAFGLAFQTHPATLVLLPGAAVYVLWWGRRWLRTPWPYLALLLFVLAWSNLIVFNLMTSGGTFREAATVRDRYDAGVAMNTLVYLQTHLTHAYMLLRYLAGAVDLRVSVGAYLLDPTLWLYGALSLGGLIYCARRGAPLLLLMALSSILIMPWFNQRKYVPISDGRYLMPLLPLAYAAIGALLADGFRAIAPRDRSRRIAVAAAVLALVIYPLVPLSRYFDQEIRAGRTNQPLLTAVDTVRAVRRPDEPVVLDRDLADVKFDGGGTAFRSLRVLLAGVGIDDRSTDSVFDYGSAMAPGSSALLITHAEGFERLKPEIGRLAARDVRATPGHRGPGEGRLRRVPPRTGRARGRRRRRPGWQRSPPSSAAFGRSGLSTYASPARPRQPGRRAGRTPTAASRSSRPTIRAPRARPPRIRASPSRRSPPAW